jgi:hypothetical protein
MNRKRGETLQEAGVGFEVRPKIREVTNARVDVSQGRLLIGTPSAIHEHWKLVHEVPNRVWYSIRSLVGLAGHFLGPDTEMVLEELDLVGFAFEIIEMKVAQDEVKARQLGFYVIERVGATIPEILPANGSVERLIRQLVDPRIVLVLALVYMLLQEGSLDEGADGAA